MTTKTNHLEVLPASAPIKMEETAGVLNVRVPAGVEVTLIERFQRRDPEPYTTNSRIALTIEDGARVKHYKLVLEGAHADHQSSIEVAVGKNAAFYSNVFLMGGEHIRNTIQVRLAGEYGECQLNGLYVGNGKQKIETHTLIDHQKPHGSSREFYKGILDEESQGIFDGLIIVAKEAQKTDSAQSNKNLLLSPKAKAQSVPELKIFANDVKCKHGSTIGQLDAQQLFYLRSRGIPEAEARRLLINAFASEMIELIEIDELKATLFTMSELNDLYQEVILDHSRHPHNYHAMEGASRKANGYNPLCGDQVTVYLKLNQDKIEDISFEGNGCAISKSSASVMTDLIKGKSKEETSAMFERFRKLVTGETKPGDDPTDKMAIFAGVSEFPTRVKCAVLAWHTLKSALENKSEPINTEGL